MTKFRAPTPPATADDRSHGGRPKAEPCTSLSTWLPNREYDRLVRLAHKDDQSLSALVRQALKYYRR